jgi:hypothetical protein
MSSDCDDTGALAIAHQFANNGETEIIAVMVNDGDPHTPACVDAINTYHGRPGIPVGVGKIFPLQPCHLTPTKSYNLFPIDSQTQFRMR